MGRFLATLATILILVLGVAFILPAFTDWNAYRSDVEEAASALLGHKIKIAGKIDVVILPEPRLRANKVVALGDTTSGAIITADAVDLTLSLPALVGGKVDYGASEFAALAPPPLPASATSCDISWMTNLCMRSWSPSEMAK